MNSIAVVNSNKCSPTALLKWKLHMKRNKRMCKSMLSDADLCSMYIYIYKRSNLC